MTSGGSSLSEGPGVDVYGLRSTSINGDSIDFPPPDRSDSCSWKRTSVVVTSDFRESFVEGATFPDRVRRSVL